MHRENFQGPGHSMQGSEQVSPVSASGHAAEERFGEPRAGQATASSPSAGAERNQPGGKIFNSSPMEASSASPADVAANQAGVASPSPASLPELSYTGPRPFRTEAVASPSSVSLPERSVSQGVLAESFFERANTEAYSGTRQCDSVSANRNNLSESHCGSDTSPPSEAVSAAVSNADTLVAGGLHGGLACESVSGTVSTSRARAVDESGEAEVANRKPRRQWLWWLVVVLGVLGLVIGPVGVWLTAAWFGGLAQLEAAMAEADATYPHWRWEDLIRQREEVPPEENAWPIIEQIAERYRNSPHARNLDLSPVVPRSWIDYPREHPNRRLPEVMEQRSRQWLEADPALLALIEQLHGSRKAQAPTPRLGVNPWHTFSTAADVLRPAANACRIVHDHYLQHGGDRQAEFVLLGLWRIVEAVDDSVLDIDQLDGVAYQGFVLERLERHLAMRELSPEMRQEMQRLLDKQLEKHEQRALWAIRGERAFGHEAFNRVREGRLGWPQFLAVSLAASSLASQPDTFLERIEAFLKEKLPDRAAIVISYFHQHRLHAEYLHDLNRLERAALKSEHDLEGELKAIATELEKRNSSWWRRVVARLHYVHPSYLMFESFRGARLSLEATRAGLAAEKFRIEHGRLPTNWNALVPRYLPYLPHDRYAGGPFQFKTTADGIVIYSFG